MKSKEEIENQFQEILKRKNSQMVWDFVTTKDKNLTEEDKIKYHSEFLKHTWHTSHEEIVSSFQWYANPKTIDILYETALKENIDRMEYKPIARRCTWALADIGTNESKNKLIKLSKCGDNLIEGFAKKRIEGWENETHRKGMKIFLKSKGRHFIYIDYYLNLKPQIETNRSQIVTGHQSEENIIVYQAFNNEIANYVIKNQKFGGPNYSFKRMTWIKPNFLWMMYRSGWATKPNQERILAISISKKFFEKLLYEGEMTSINQTNYKDESFWRNLLNRSEIRIQWDPHHRPDGSKLERKAVQIGLKGNLQKEFGTNQINYIEDITKFVKEQKRYLDRNEIGHIKIPIETIIEIKNKEIIEKLSIKE